MIHFIFPKRILERIGFPYTQTAITISYFILPFLFFFGLEFSGIYKNLFSTGESLFYYFPLKMLSRDIPLWNDLICTGNPALADPQFQSFYPISLVLMNLFPPPLSFNCFILIHYTLAGFFTYLFLRALGLSRTSSYWGSVVFMFCGFFVGHRRHIAILNAGIWLPLVLFSLEKVWNTFQARYFLLGTFGIAMSILAGYPHVTMLMSLVTLAYAFSKIFSSGPQNRKWRLVLIAIFMQLFGTLLSALQLFPTIEALRITTRESINYQFFTMYSFGFQFLPMLIYPYLYGGGYSSIPPVFRSPRAEVTEFSGYIGILPLILVILAIAIYRNGNQQIRFWTIVAAASFVLILGNTTPVYRWLYHVPIYNLFRGPARNWYECDFALAILSSFGMEALLHKRDVTEKIKRWATFLAFGCLLIVGISIFAFRMIRESPNRHDYYSAIQVDPKVMSNNLELHSPAVWVPMFLLGFSACFLILVPRLPRTTPVLLALILFLCMDLFYFGYYHERFFIRYSDITQATGPISFLKSQPDSDLFRVFCTSDLNFRTLLSPDTNMLYGIHTINGFEDVLLRDYSLLTGFNYLGVVRQKQERSLLIQNTLLSIMSTKFVGTQDRELAALLRNASRSGRPFYTLVFKSTLAPVESQDIRRQIPDPIYEKKAGKRTGVLEIFRNENFLPRVRFATTVIPSRDLDQAIRFIRQTKAFDFQNTVISETGDSSIRHVAEGVILSSTFSPRRIQIAVKTDQESFLVLADQFYQGWKATVDGIETTIYRTNAIMRGIYISKPGVHTVEFRFFPESLRYGLYISSATLLLLVIFVLVHSNRQARTARGK